MRSENPIDRFRLDQLPNDFFMFLSSDSIRFALSSIEASNFNIPIEEKLKHFLSDDKLSWKSPRVKIIPPEMSGNAAFYSYVDVEFTLPRLSLEQKLDILHFTICALNYLSTKDNSIDTLSIQENLSSNLNSKTNDLKVVSDLLNQVRDSIIFNALRDKQGFDDNSEFDENLPDVARILKAQNEDLKTEKQWLDENSAVFVKPEAETEEINLDEKLKITLTARQWIIAMRFFINHYELRHIDVTAFARLLAVFNGGKNQKNLYDNLRNERGLITAKTREDAKEVSDLCRDVGLSKIADEIERAIKKVKTNNL